MVDTTGSSPRVRGAVRDALATVDDVGIIPARAGSSFRSGWPNWCSRDHPRACGEQNAGMANPVPYTGSSPRVRGAGSGLEQRGRHRGIIPARAGSRIPYEWVDGPKRDHPRACGEQESIVVDPSASSGSSPRVRGAGPSPITLGATCGIIPARAGSSRACGRGATGSWDHPRACGEQNPPVVVADGNVGSSPRMRGAALECGELVVEPGIIPARAGSSLSSSSLSRSSWDHPRACGEQLSSFRLGLLAPGSSPRVRGAV